MTRSTVTGVGPLVDSCVEGITSKESNNVRCSASESQICQAGVSCRRTLTAIRWLRFIIDRTGRKVASLQDAVPFEIDDASGEAEPNTIGDVGALQTLRRQTVFPTGLTSVFTWQRGPPMCGGLRASAADRTISQRSITTLTCGTLAQNAFAAAIRSVAMHNNASKGHRSRPCHQAKACRTRAAPPPAATAMRLPSYPSGPWQKTGLC